MNRQFLAREVIAPHMCPSRKKVHIKLLARRSFKINFRDEKKKKNAMARNLRNFLATLLCLLKRSVYGDRIENSIMIGSGR